QHVLAVAVPVGAGTLDHVYWSTAYFFQNSSRIASAKSFPENVSGHVIAGFEIRARTRIIVHPGLHGHCAFRGVPRLAQEVGDEAQAVAVGIAGTLDDGKEAKQTFLVPNPFYFIP